MATTPKGAYPGTGGYWNRMSSAEALRARIPGYDMRAQTRRQPGWEEPGPYDDESYFTRPHTGMQAHWNPGQDAAAVLASGAGNITMQPRGEFPSFTDRLAQGGNNFYGSRYFGGYQPGGRARPGGLTERLAQLQGGQEGTGIPGLDPLKTGDGTAKTGGFFGGGRGLGANMETLQLLKSGYDLYGNIQDRAAAERAEERAIAESARIGKYAAVNLANKGGMINFRYDNLENWMDVNDPNKERYTRPTRVATSI